MRFFSLTENPSDATATNNSSNIIIYALIYFSALIAVPCIKLLITHCCPPRHDPSDSDDDNDDSTDELENGELSYQQTPYKV